MSGVNLSRQLVLETPQLSPDGAGGFQLSWVGLGTLWGEIIPGSGREAAGIEQNLASVNYRITVRAAAFGASARPKPEQRLRDGERLFTILAVSERDASGLYLTCLTKEEQPT
jgi:head-tail adaptor